MSPTKKHIDLSSFIALGDSITAGYKDGALFYEGQLNSFPNLLARQFGSKFQQPLVDASSVGIGFFGNSRLVLKKEENGAELSYVLSHGDPGVFSDNCYSGEGPFNNLGVPGVKAITLLASGYGDKNRGEGNYNPFYFRMSSDPEKASVLSDALFMRPTFFSLFVGNNDVLAYALSGGTSDSITPIVGPPGTGFESSLHFVVDHLIATGAKGAISNLPCLTSIPFFNTIAYNDLLLDAGEKDKLNSRYSFAGFKFEAGKNRFIIEDPACKNGLRQIDKDEFILLEILLDENKKEYLRGLKPVPKKYYLSKEQIERSQNALSLYNAIIKNIADKHRLAFIDTDCLLKGMKPDRAFDSSSGSIKYRTGGVFSLDGLHINKLGHAVLANEFIKVINQTYQVHINKINLTKFRGDSFL